jgi:hypothetical protein
MTNTKTEQLEWKRNKVQELAVKGFAQFEICKMLQIDKSTICRDIAFLKAQAKETIKNHIQDRLPYEYGKCLQGLEEIIKESWIIATKADKTGDTKEKLQSLALIKDSYSTKMDLLTNANLLSDSIKFLEDNKEKLSNSEINDKMHKQDRSNRNDNDNDIQGFSQDSRTAESAVF